MDVLLSEEIELRRKLGFIEWAEAFLRYQQVVPIGRAARVWSSGATCRCNRSNSSTQHENEGEGSIGGWRREHDACTHPAFPRLHAGMCTCVYVRVLGASVARCRKSWSLRDS